MNALLYTVKIVMIPLIFAVWVLSCFSDNLPFSYTMPGQDVNNPSPEWNASFLSHLFFWWFNPLVTLGYKKPLVMEDVYDLAPQNTAKVTTVGFQKHWSFEKHPGILWPLVKTFWSDLATAASFKFVASWLTFASPTILDYLLVWMADPTAPSWRGYFYAGNH